MMSKLGFQGFLGLRGLKKRNSNQMSYIWNSMVLKPEKNISCLYFNLFFSIFTIDLCLNYFKGD